jgi:hypothetical protein
MAVVHLHWARDPVVVVRQRGVRGSVAVAHLHWARDLRGEVASAVLFAV